MLTAKEAHEKSMENVDTIVKNELAIIEKRIEIAIGQGHFTCTGDESIRDETKQELEKLGYTVETGKHYETPWYVVSWTVD